LYIHPKLTPYLTTKSLVPENQETPIHHVRTWAVNEELFYKRNHFPYPVLPKQSYFLPIQGEVVSPKNFRYQDLLNMPSRTLTVVLECSGNNRANFSPKVYGEQWEEGAISEGEWKGVPLRDLLKYTGVRESAIEVVFEGFDFGQRTDMPGQFSFTRSLPLDKALHPDTLIAYEYNGKPIPLKHGYPLRVIVPQWYAMASVKWLRRITIVGQEFLGPFQSKDYVYYPNEENDAGKNPVTVMKVNSIIQYPLNRAILVRVTHPVFGIAWTGKGEIIEVEISTDNGQSWVKSRNAQKSRSTLCMDVLVICMVA
jgi:DMSO/TMAO reductase YedYZ molybdopterin-dependent catalytic subunit